MATVCYRRLRNPFKRYILDLKQEGVPVYWAGTPSCIDGFGSQLFIEDIAYRARGLVEMVLHMKPGRFNIPLPVSGQYLLMPA